MTLHDDLFANIDPTEDTADTTDEHTTWQPVDLTDALNGTDITPPTLLARTDGIHLLYPARVHWLQGESESLKSWLCQLAVAQEIQAGHHVYYLDFEDEARGVTARLKSLGLSSDQILQYLTYVRPDEPLTGSHHGNETYGAAHAEFTAALHAHPYTLCVIDGITEAMTIEGLNLLDNADIATFMRKLPKRIASTGPAVACIDHVTKATEGRGRYAIGGQHKLAGVTGATYEVTAIKALSRASSEPVEGAARITVHKDRPGWVRSKATGGVIATLEITAWPDGNVSAVLVPGSTTPAPPLALITKVMEHLKIYDGATKRDMREAIDAKGIAVDACLMWLAEDGRAWIRIEKVGNSHRHLLTPEGRIEMGWA